MIRELKLFLGAVLLLLPFMVTTTYASEKPISMTWEGTVTDTAINVNADDLFANVISAQARGSFAATSLSVLTEFVFSGLCNADPSVLYLTVWYSKPITTFANGDQLWGNVTSGWMCLNAATGEFTGEAEGEYEGGTGRFVGATGSFIVPFGGINLTLPSLGVGHGVIHGEVHGTVVLP